MSYFVPDAAGCRVALAGSTGAGFPLLRVLPAGEIIFDFRE